MCDTNKFVFFMYVVSGLKACFILGGEGGGSSSTLIALLCPALGRGGSCPSQRYDAMFTSTFMAGLVVSGTLGFMMGIVSVMQASVSPYIFRSLISYFNKKKKRNNARSRSHAWRSRDPLVTPKPHKRRQRC